MPELPDVEVFRRYLDSRVLGRLIRRIDLAAPEMAPGASPRSLSAHLRRARFRSTCRHGKYLFLEIDRGGWLFLHFGMTGYPLVDGKDAADRPRLAIRFADGRRLTYYDRRKLGQIGLVEDVAGFIRSRRLGPDALAVEEAAFGARLKERRGAVKAALMDQHVIAGLGNVYVDEVLFQAGLHPTAALARVEPATRARLYRVMRRILERAIAAGAEPSRLPRRYQLPHRRKGGRCPRCGNRWKTMKVGGRTTYYCERDQRNRR